MKNKIVQRIINISIPLLIIGLFAFACSFLYLHEGITGGDDVRFHLGVIYDTYYGVKHGLPLDSTEHLLMGAYGYNTHLFYAPFPHYFAVFLMLIFGCSNIVAVKVSVSLSTFIAASFVYFLAMKITKRQLVSLVASAFYVFCPYRMFCALCRFAYAETIAMAFIPVFMYGIYAVTHDEKPQYRSFLAVLLGAAGLILSHPFTALMSAIVAVLYLAVHYRGTWGFLKTKKGIILSAATVVLIIASVGFYAFPMVHALRSGLYRMSDAQAVWTNYDHVAGSTANSWQFSGFLNLIWIQGRLTNGNWPEAETPTMMAIGVALVLIGCIIAGIADHFLKKAPKNIIYRLPITIVLSYLPLLFFVQRAEVYIAVGAFDLVLLASNLFPGKATIMGRSNHVALNKDRLTDVIFYGIVTVVLLILIFVNQSWYFMPNIFYTCQFAWRLWSIVSYTLTAMFIIALNALAERKNRIPFFAVASIPFILFAASQCYPEKRVAYEFENANANVYTVYEEEQLKAAANIGAMNEYIPLCFYDAEYQPTYPNSLYSKVRGTIGRANRYQFDAESYLDPAFLEGSGTITVTELNTPSVDFHAIISENGAFIQIPQFYYDGYVVDIYDLSGNRLERKEAEMVDSLVAFHVDSGEYDIQVRYIGSKSKRIWNIVFFVAAPLDLTFAGFALYEWIKLQTKRDNDDGEKTKQDENQTKYVKITKK